MPDSVAMVMTVATLMPGVQEKSVGFKYSMKEELSNISHKYE